MNKMNDYSQNDNDHGLGEVGENQQIDAGCTETKGAGEEPQVADESIIFSHNEQKPAPEVPESERISVTVVHKHVPSIGVILVTAITFLCLGAIIASGILLARYMEIDTLRDAMNNVDTNPNATNPPLVTAPPNSNSDQSSQGQGGQGSFEEGIPLNRIYTESVDGVVLIKSYGSNRKTDFNLIGIGTGFFISADGYILTNAHVVADAVSVSVTLYDGSIVDARVVGSDISTDIAVLRVSAKSVPKALVLGNSNTVVTGDFVLAIGHPTGEELKFTATFGTVGAVNRDVIIDGIRNTYIQIDAAINPGNSGGPLFDMNGHVIGINSAKTVVASYDEDGTAISAEGLGFALPINRAMEVAGQIIEQGSIERPGIGVSVITIEEERAEMYDIPQGVLVYSVVKDGPAHKAGLYADDIIITADGIDIMTKEQFIEIVQQKKVGDSVELEFWRDGQILTCTLVVGNLNEIGSEVLDNVYGGEDYGFIN